MGNSGKDRFLAKFPVASVDLEDNDLTRRSKFNFSYFVGLPPGQEFNEWTHDDLSKLLGKLKDFSREPLKHWTKQPAGKSGSVLSVYGDFPKKSGFEIPRHVPFQARWGRFRLDWSARLVGFVLPDSYHDNIHDCGTRFDCNTFYVVFLDSNHEFWKSEAK